MFCWPRVQNVHVTYVRKLLNTLQQINCSQVELNDPLWKKRCWTGFHDSNKEKVIVLFLVLVPHFCERTTTSNTKLWWQSFPISLCLTASMKKQLEPFFPPCSRQSTGFGYVRPCYVRIEVILRLFCLKLRSTLTTARHQCSPMPLPITSLFHSPMNSFFMPLSSCLHTILLHSSLKIGSGGRTPQNRASKSCINHGGFCQSNLVW